LALGVRSIAEGGRMSYDVKSCNVNDKVVIATYTTHSAQHNSYM
jgi:hypothetical protein